MIAFLTKIKRSQKSPYGRQVYENLHKPSSNYLYSSHKMAFGNSKPSRRSSPTTHPPPNPPQTRHPREVPMADRFLKNYINHPQTTCTHPVKWRLEIPNRLGGVRGQRHPRLTCDGQTDRHALKGCYTHRKYKFFFFYFYEKSLG